MFREFDINILMELCEEKKYATTVAGFEVIDMSEAIETPKKMQKSKLAVRAMGVLGGELVKWNYIEEGDRQALREELGLVPPQISEEAEAAPIPIPIREKPAKTTKAKSAKEEKEKASVKSAEKKTKTKAKAKAKTKG